MIFRLAANAAAAAWNEAVWLTVYEYGNENTFYHNNNCPTYLEYLEDEQLDDDFEAYLLSMISQYFGLQVWEWDFAFDSEPVAQIGYSGAYVPETTKVLDYSMIVYLWPDNCLE